MAIFTVPEPKNEPVQSYAPGSLERNQLIIALNNAQAAIKEIPMYIAGKAIFTNDKQKISPPHNHKHILGYFHKGNKIHVEQAISAALEAKPAWENMPWESRVSIFLKAADLLAGPFRAKINAATMLGQSKNAYQAEIDGACEMIDFLRFNAKYVEQLYKIQPESSPGVWNRTAYRPLEGFVFAITPFNFTAIAGNLPTAPALLGNTVIWKPAFTQIYSAVVLMEVFMEAGLPDGVINLLFTDGPETGEVIFAHPDFAGLHYTGSTKVFRTLWREIGNNIDRYNTYPRIVGETGGKDFVLAHKTADTKALAVALVRGAFEYQGQKCSAASRAYIPDSIWKVLLPLIQADLQAIKTGPVEDFSNFVNAVIDEKAFDKIAGYIESAKEDPDVEVIAGGNFDKSIGYFIEPTILLTKNPTSQTMCEEIFGPVLTIYVYPENDFDTVLGIINTSSPYALTGAVFAKDRYIIEHVAHRLKDAAGNFYINDKPTGAVVGQQPFGGARASGTNDKAGSVFNLLRWVSPRTIKENFVPPKDFRYPFMED